MQDEIFTEIRKTCKGQLRPNVYREIYETTLAAPAGDVLEIGTAHGAATVVIARAMRDSGRGNRVYTVGKPGVGSHIGDPKALQTRFERYGVDGLTTAIIAEASEAIGNLPADIAIGLLMLDADGRIDRDFDSFFNKVVRGAPIIIDDYEDRVSMKLGRRGRALGIGLKSRLTFALANYFRDCGYLEDFRVVNQTLFCRKAAVSQPVVFDRQAIWDLYGSIIFSWQPLDRRELKLLLASLRDVVRPPR